MVLINPKTKKEYFLPLKKIAGEEASICPECSEHRKKKTQKCFSFNHDIGAGRCNHCQVALVLKREYEPKKEYKRPEWKNKTNLSAPLVKWFEGRGINQQTLIDFKISEGPEYMPQTQGEVNTVQFNYFRDGQLVNIKYRDGFKNFKLYSGAELILYNLDSVKESEEVFICEGEIDAMSMHQAGYKTVVSVPNGAGNGKINLEYLDNCIEYFYNKKKVYLCTDNDLPGRNLQEQLAERLGKERCFKVIFKDCKDANDCLIKYGIQGIMDAIADKREFPLEGVFEVKDYSTRLKDIHDNGPPPGAKTMMRGLNELLEFHLGYMTGIIGIPNMGKSSFLDQLALQLSLVNDWKGVYYSPENQPTELHLTNVLRKLIGKRWRGDNGMTNEEIDMGVGYLQQKFFFIEPEDSVTIDSILEKTNQLILKKGINFLIIDAWNTLEHKYLKDETKYIGESLEKMSRFCKMKKIHLFLVVHPRKMEKGKDGKYLVPGPYDMAGSSNFFNKLANIMCFHRDYDENVNRLYVQKVKFDSWGKQGMVEFKYEPDSGRFAENVGGSIELSFDKNPWIHGIKKAENKDIISGNDDPFPF